MRALAAVLMLAAVGLCSQAWSAEPSPAAGGQLFERRCGVCHLKGQTGTNMLERRLGAQRALLAERTDLTPEYIRFVVRQGLVNMPRLTRVELPDAELEAISAWLRRPRP